MASSTPSNTTSLPVTRVACFKFHPNVTDAQKAGRTSAFLDLYASHQELILGLPKGGRPLNTPLDLTNVKREKGWDTGFVVVFKDDAARKEFDTDAGHDRLKNETDPLLEQVFVYDFVEQTNLGW
ncbi:uncharacterized protein K460DRAFT_370161 [Cucurbitaria berberidis CBS 394.84]|uniref:Stress-response A/B barrel domain-containing protein n=1 Tax=Cucurbitaria berberidis CBS 394.84 TaxID=1168544 RepID=A0A9P4GAV3_9PLEO|nr:uncharacterized protein K460DRAFT_370161 [Cucurbitaria berberidis CBS 394.84]KAF1842176.1 hypothetical protein K460DRAFT_370161 [Cucurbitaria berberidis CBS 394.84]